MTSDHAVTLDSRIPPLLAVCLERAPKRISSVGIFAVETTPEFSPRKIASSRARLKQCLEAMRAKWTADEVGQIGSFLL